MRASVPDRRHHAARRRPGGAGLRHLHRLRLLRGRLSVSGAHHRPRPALVLRPRDQAGAGGKARGAPGRGAEMHLLQGPRRRRARARPDAGRRPGGDTSVLCRLHLAGDPVRRFQGPAEQCLDLGARPPAFPAECRARHRPADQVSLHHAGGAGTRSRGNRGGRGALERSGQSPGREAADPVGLARGDELDFRRHQLRHGGGGVAGLACGRRACAQGSRGPVRRGGADGDRTILRVPENRQEAALLARRVATADELDDARNLRGRAVLCRSARRPPLAERGHGDAGRHVRDAVPVLSGENPAPRARHLGLAGGAGSLDDRRLRPVRRPRPVDADAAVAKGLRLRCLHRSRLRA